MLPIIDIKTALDYEVHASRWICRVRWPFLQKLVGSYVAWRLKRKYARYLRSKQAQKLFSDRTREQALTRFYRNN